MLYVVAMTCTHAACCVRMDVDIYNTCISCIRFLLGWKYIQRRCIFIDLFILYHIKLKETLCSILLIHGNGNSMSWVRERRDGTDVLC